MTALFSRNKTAFSFIELSMVIVIIGLLVAGSLGSKHIIKKANAGISTGDSLSRKANFPGVLVFSYATNLI